MQKEWVNMPLVKVTTKDREMGSLVLKGIPNDGSAKLTRGFVYYQVVNGDFLLAKDYEKFLLLLKAHIMKVWGEHLEWDELIKDKKLEDLEWDPHLEAYFIYKRSLERIKKII